MATSTQPQPAQPKPNPVISVIHKIGDTILHVFEWPITHAQMLGELLHNVEKDVPDTRDVLQGLISRIEAMGPDAIMALADKGLNIPDDIKVGSDLQNLFTYVKQSVLPTIELDYTDFKKITGPGGAAGAPLPVAQPAGEPQAGPGLHTVTAS